MSPKQGIVAQVSSTTIGCDGNIGPVVAEVRHVLSVTGRHDLAQELGGRIIAAHTYKAALEIVQEYVDLPTARRLERLIESGGVNLDD